MCNQFHILLLRITLLFNGLYTALMAVTFIPDALNEFSRPEFICFVIAAVIPLYLQVTGKRRMVGTLTHIGCIGSGTGPWAALVRAQGPRATFGLGPTTQKDPIWQGPKSPKGPKMFPRRRPRAPKGTRGQ